jgi:hypothetical protein
MLKGAIDLVKKERARLMSQVEALDKALSALGSSHGGTSKRGTRTMSASARKRIAAAQKARWAKWRATKRKAS